MNAIPNIINVILIAALFFLIFAIVGVNFLKGLFYYCDTSNLPDFTSFEALNVQSKWDCLNIGGEWMPYINSFNDVGQSLITIFSMSQTFSWANVMYKAMAATKIDYMPKQYSNPYYSLYFVIFIVIGAFFITNLFVGVVISTYNREKEKIGHNFLLTE